MSGQRLTKTDRQVIVVARRETKLGRLQESQKNLRGVKRVKQRTV